MFAIWNRINTVILLLVLFALLAVIGMLASGARGGPLDPPGAPAPTLPQVEPRSPIPPVGWNGVFPIVISQPGSYFSTRSLVGVAGQNGIQISSARVTLDLNGFILDGTAAGTGSGVVATTGSFDLRVHNGLIRNWDGHGLDLEAAAGSRIHDVHVSNAALDGVRLGSATRLHTCQIAGNDQVGVRLLGGGTTVEDCTINNNVFQGIRSESNHAVIRSNLLFQNGFPNATGIWIRGQDSVVTDNTLLQNYNYGMWVGGAGAGSGAGTVVARNVAAGNANGGYNIFAGDVGPVGTAAAATSPWANITD